jgi:hypothetical protein
VYLQGGQEAGGIVVRKPPFDSDELRGLSMMARKGAIGPAFQPFARTPRDLAVATGKLVRRP